MGKFTFQGRSGDGFDPLLIVWIESLPNSHHQDDLYMPLLPDGVEIQDVTLCLQGRKNTSESKVPLEHHRTCVNTTVTVT